MFDTFERGSLHVLLVGFYSLASCSCGGGTAAEESSSTVGRTSISVDDSSGGHWPMTSGSDGVSGEESGSSTGKAGPVGEGSNSSGDSTSTGADTQGGDSSGSDSGTAESTGGLVGGCGNGVLEAGEICDDCDAASEDCGQTPDTACLYWECSTGACVGCVPASCGDGVRNRSDGRLEECDDGNQQDGDTCDKNCRREFVAFVTSAEYTSGLKLADWSDGYQSSLEGVHAADDICRHAAEAFLPDEGTQLQVRAWLADETLESAPAVRFSNDVRSSTRIVRRDGKQLAAGWEALLSGELDNAVNVTETGASVGNNVKVWTNVTVSGLGGGDDCYGWKESAIIWPQQGQYGITGAVFSDWTAKGAQSCAGTGRLYCFTQ